MRNKGTDNCMWAEEEVVYL